MTFFDYFILSCFKKDRFMKATTLYHLLKGKRTSSILSYGYFFEVIAFFGIFKDLSEKEYLEIIHALKNNKLLIDKQGYLKLSEAGCEALFQIEFPDMQHINQLSFYNWDLPFFERLLFSSQVISEKAHQNADYLPIETNFYKQLQMKEWFKRQNSRLPERFYAEWYQLVIELTSEEKQLILEQLVGHNVRGLTLNQIADKQKRDYYDVFLSFKNVWHKLLSTLINNKQNYPLFNDLCQTELNYQINDSRKKTLQLFKKGHSINQIAELRSLKVGTITDHLIDEFIVTGNMDYFPNFSEDIIIGLEKLKKDKPLFYYWTYKEAQAFCPTISFYEFRFFQFYLKDKE